MRAYQCDRCGRLYSYSSKDTNKIFITDSYASVACNRIKDLCGECQKEFEEWWMTKKWTEAEDEQATSEETQKESNI